MGAFFLKLFIIFAKTNETPSASYSDMAKNKKPLPIYENVTIAACAAEGKCVTRVDDKVVFVPFVVPGDVVDLQVRKKRKSYCEAEVIRLVEPSQLRQAPMCRHFSPTRSSCA